MIYDKNWQTLKKGDIIDVIAPSGWPLKNTNIIIRAIQLIESLDFIPRIPKNIYAKGANLFSANSDDARFDMLKNALYANDSKAIWPIRGGYGASKLIPKLTQLVPPRKNKVLLGFSDITALHLFVNQQWHWATLHSKVIAQFYHDQDALDVEQINNILTKPNLKLYYHDLLPLNIAAKTRKKIESSLIGGNFTLIHHSIATNWQLNCQNKIVFFEDLNEAGYKIDRVLEHFIQANLLQGAKAIIFGDFTEGVAENDHHLIFKAINNFADKFDIPVLSYNKIGHGKYNDPMPIGTRSILTLGKKISLECESGGI